MKKDITKVLHEAAKIRIGKKGLTEAIIVEVEKLLKKDGAIKIKCLKTIPKESIPFIAKNIADLTESQVVDIRGKTFVLYKSR
ncbi:MAG: YhbY family RNA-binding protein [Candidatus Heimdallarchaeaceae archaeon]